MLPSHFHRPHKLVPGIISFYYIYYRYLKKMYIHYNNSHKMALTIKTIFSVYLIITTLIFCMFTSSLMTAALKFYIYVVNSYIGWSTTQSKNLFVSHKAPRRRCCCPHKHKTIEAPPMSRPDNFFSQRFIVMSRVGRTIQYRYH